MYGMKSERIEVRLDADHVKKLGELKAEYGTSVSDVVRRSLDALYQEERERRKDEALARILAFEGGEEMPDPEELRRQIIEGWDYELPDSD